MGILNEIEDYGKIRKCRRVPIVTKKASTKYKSLIQRKFAIPRWTPGNLNTNEARK